MNLKKIIVIAVCLASLTATAQQQSPQDCDQGKHKRVHPMPHIPYWISSTPVEMYINGLHCSVQFRSKDKAVQLILNCGFHPCLSLDNQSEIIFLLQDGSTATAMSQGSQSGGIANPPYCRDCGTPKWQYQYSYTFCTDTAQIRKLVITGVKSGCLYTTVPSVNPFNGQSYPHKTFFDLEARDNEDINPAANDFINQYARHFGNAQPVNPGH